MGEARRRGTREQRIADAERRAQERLERQRAESRRAFERDTGLPGETLPESGYPYRRGSPRLAAILALLAARGIGLDALAKGVRQR